MKFRFRTRLQDFAKLEDYRHGANCAEFIQAFLRQRLPLLDVAGRRGYIAYGGGAANTSSIDSVLV
jgi:hypothetical protein